MNHSFPIPFPVTVLAKEFATKDDQNRLGGVFFSAHGLAVATDGHTLAQVDCPGIPKAIDNSQPLDCDGRWISREILIEAGKHAKYNGSILAEWSSAPIDGPALVTVTATNAKGVEASWKGTAPNLAFPDWLQVTRSTVEHPQACEAFNFALFARFDALTKALASERGDKKPHGFAVLELGDSGRQATVRDDEGNFLGLIMPARSPYLDAQRKSGKTPKAA